MRKAYPFLVVGLAIALSSQSRVQSDSETPSASPAPPASRSARVLDEPRHGSVPIRAIGQMISIFTTRDPASMEAAEPVDPEVALRNFVGNRLQEEDLQVAMTTLRQAASDIDAIREEARDALNHFQIDGIRLFDTAFMRRLDERRQRVYLQCVANLHKRLSPEGWTTLEDTLRKAARKGRENR